MSARICWYVEHEPDGAGGYRERRRLYRSPEAAEAVPVAPAPPRQRGAARVAQVAQGALL